MLQAVVETLLFYHPAVWWISNRMRSERENCCDDIAADLCGDKRTYAAALAALEARRGSAFTSPTAATGGELLRPRPPAAAIGIARAAGLCGSVAIVSLVTLILAGAVVGWSLLRSPREHTVDLAKGDKNKTDKPTVEVLVVQSRCCMRERRSIGSRLKPESPRSRPSICAGHGHRHRRSTSSIPIQIRHFDATATLATRRKIRLGLRQPDGIKPTTNPSPDLPQGTEIGEYYMDGHVRRSGVYNMTGRKISLRQALIAAGGVEPGFETAAPCDPRSGNVESPVVQNVKVDDLLNGLRRDTFLKPNDVIRVGGQPALCPATRQAILNAPPDGATGEYYLDGDVRAPASIA